MLSELPSGLVSDLVWNIVWEASGISWTWAFEYNTTWSKRVLTWDDLSFSNQSIESFLNDSDGNYLILFNAWNTVGINYNLQVLDILEYFSKPKTEIIASGEIGWYKQNLRIALDNTKYLNILKYSIYSN